MNHASNAERFYSEIRPLIEAEVSDIISLRQILRIKPSFYLGWYIRPNFVFLEIHRSLFRLCLEEDFLLNIRKIISKYPVTLEISERTLKPHSDKYAIFFKINPLPLGWDAYFNLKEGGELFQ